MDKKDKESLKKILSESNAIDKKEKYIYFDRVWLNPKNIIDITEIIYNEIIKLNEKENYLPDDRSKLVVLTSDAVNGNLGVIPVGFYLADKLNCSAAIWKELANMRWATSSIFGGIDSSKKCIFIQDVLDKGTIAMKIAPKLKELNWDFSLFLSVVLSHQSNEGIIAKSLNEVTRILGHKPMFINLIEYRDL